MDIIVGCVVKEVDRGGQGDGVSVSEGRFFIPFENQLYKPLVLGADQAIIQGERPDDGVGGGNPVHDVLKGLLVPLQFPDLLGGVNDLVFVIGEDFLHIADVLQGNTIIAFGATAQDCNFHFLLSFRFIDSNVDYITKNP
jgi:hypothetical protein